MSKAAKQRKEMLARQQQASAGLDNAKKPVDTEQVRLNVMVPKTRYKQLKAKTAGNDENISDVVRRSIDQYLAS